MPNSPTTVQQLPRENVLYVKYEDLKDKTKRVNAMHGVTQFLGIDASPEQLECSFILAENPGAHRKVDDDSMTVDDDTRMPAVRRRQVSVGPYVCAWPLWLMT